MGCQSSVDSGSPSKLKYQFSPQLFVSLSENNPETSSPPSEPSLVLDRSIRNYQQLIQSNPLIEHPFDGLGCVEDQVGYFETRVEDWYRAGREKGTIQGNPYDALSLCLSLKEETGEAEQWYLRMLEREPRAYQLHFGLGNLFYKRHDFLRAEDSYRKAIDLNPRLDRAYQNIAAIYCYHLHDNGQASQWATFALKINRRNQYAALMRELVKEDIPSKMEGLKKINSKYPTFVRVHNALGLCFLEQNEAEMAISWFKKGLEINPQFYVLMCGLAMAYNSQGNSDTAIKLSQQSIVLNPKHHEPYFTMGEAYSIKGHFQEAEQWYRKCIQINASFKLPYLELGRMYLKQGRGAQALELLQSISMDSELLDGVSGSGHMLLGVQECLSVQIQQQN